MIIDWNLYKPSDLEAWVTQQYQINGIHYPNDLSIRSVASIFGIEVLYHDGPCFAEWNDNEGYAFIFLDNRRSIAEQKCDFFHELCHPLRHVGTQDKLPELFQELQEIQAGQFQAVASMPAYLLQQVPVEAQWHNFIHAIAEAFGQPNKLVETRMRQVIAKIDLERRDQVFRQPRKPTMTSYSDGTNKLLEQLHKQISERRTYNVGY